MVAQTIDAAAVHGEIVPPPATSSSPAPVAAGTACGRCKEPLTDRYFMVNAHAACPDCRSALDGSMRKAVAFGLAAALLNIAVYHAIYWIMHWRFALITVIAGVLIGEAVRHGAQASKSLAYRWLSVGLTYLTAVATYSLALMEPAGTLRPVVTALHSLVLPLVMLAARENVVTLILLGFGLHEAWKFSAPPYASIEGPFTVAAPTAAPNSSV